MRTDAGRGVDDLLDVVEEEEHRAARAARRELLVEHAVTGVDDAEPFAIAAGSSRRVGHGREVDERDAARETVAHAVPASIDSGSCRCRPGR